MAGLSRIAATHGIFSENCEMIKPFGGLWVVFGGFSVFWSLDAYVDSLGICNMQIIWRVVGNSVAIWIAWENVKLFERS